MMIPLHAPNPLDAMEWMNFYYQPKIAGEVADWVNYITPGARRRRSTSPTQSRTRPSANSPLVFPTQADVLEGARLLHVKNYNDYHALEQHVQPDHPVVVYRSATANLSAGAGPRSRALRTRRRRALPARPPGWLCLAIFFVVPLVSVLSLSR